MAVVEINNLSFRWQKHGSNILKIDHMMLSAGSRTFLEGPSGSGKSSLLGLLAGVNTPQTGSVSILDTEITRLKASQRDKFRADHMGYIFQMFNLLPYLSVLENVCLPCHLSKHRKKKALTHADSLEKEAIRLLTDLKLSKEVLNRPVNSLSIGQQQRVAAARALMGKPGLVIADEPTSALDTSAREAFIKLLFEECEKENSTLLFVSHDHTLASLFDQCISLPEINQAAPKQEVIL